MRCVKCGIDHPEGSKFCIKCGKELIRPDQMTPRCPQCGKESIAGATFCTNCGKTLTPSSSAYSDVKTGGPSGQESYPGQFTSSIAKDIIFSFITCGIYMLFWQARQMKALNYLLGEEKFKFLVWLLLTLITCGLYHIYYEYVMGQSIVETQKRKDRFTSNELPVVCLVLSIFGLSIVADAIQQNEINKLFGK